MGKSCNVIYLDGCTTINNKYTLLNDLSFSACNLLAVSAGS